MTDGQFHKMHGLGNDFVIIDARDAPLEMTARRARDIADRRTGIGCDQLILLEHSDKADLMMRIYNADGGEVESCGNATRCIVALIGRDISIETKGGLLFGSITDDGITIDMGKPLFGWQDIPLAFAMDTAAMPLAWGDLSAPMAVNVGNPHVVFFVEDPAAVDLEQLGPAIENDAVFPARVNVNIAHVGGEEIALRVWERGVGETRACGTGACATAVAAIRKGLVSSPVTVRLPGGKLTIEWQQGGPVAMSGDAVHIFTGQARWIDFG